MTRVLTTILSLLFAAGVFAQYQAKYVGDNNGCVKMRCTGYAKKAKDAVAAAEISAVDVILFQGVNGASAYSSPLVSVPKKEAEDNSKRYFRDFYDGGYMRFIVSSEIVTELKKDAARRKGMTVDVTVNVKALREDLEKNDVIRRFGF